MNKKEQLKKIVFDSSILEDEKVLWEKFIEASKEEDVISILEFLEDNPKGIDFLTENLQEKIKALSKKDYFEKSQDFAKIVEKEKEYLKEGK